jgi:hypothetical protein
VSPHQGDNDETHEKKKMTVVCERPWSNRDLFFFVESCSVYLPIYNFLSFLVLLEATVCFTYGIRQSIMRTRKDVPLSATVLGLFFMINYLTLLASGKSYADGDYGLNILHAITISFIYLNLNLHGFRHLEVITSVDAHTLAKSREFHSLIKKTNIALSIGTCIIQFLKMTLPVAFPSIDFIDFVGSVTLILGTVNSIPRLTYIYQVRKIVLSAQEACGSQERAQTFYQPLVRQLTGVGTQWIGTMVVAIILNTTWMAIPLFRRSSYIVYNIQMLMAPLVGIVSLLDTRGGGKNSNAPPQKLENMASRTENNSSEKTSHRPPAETPRAGNPGSSGTSGLEPATATPEETSPLVRVETPDKLDASNNIIEGSKDPSPTLGGEDETIPIFNPFTNLSSSSHPLIGGSDPENPPSPLPEKTERGEVV